MCLLAYLSWLYIFYWLEILCLSMMLNWFIKFISLHLARPRWKSKYRLLYILWMVLIIKEILNIFFCLRYFIVETTLLGGWVHVKLFFHSLHLSQRLGYFSLKFFFTCSAFLFGYYVSVLQLLAERDNVVLNFSVGQYFDFLLQVTVIILFVTRLLFFGWWCRFAFWEKQLIHHCVFRLFYLTHLLPSREFVDIKSTLFLAWLNCLILLIFF